MKTEKKQFARVEEDASPPSRSRISRVLLTCGVIGPPLFIVTFLVEGATRTDYSPLRHPVSSLEIGGSGWMQRVNFLITGLLLLAFALALRRALRRYGAGIWGPLLITLFAVGLIGSGVFVADPISGYPPGTPMTPNGTIHGVLHNVFGIPVFLGLPAACAVIGYRFATSGRTGWAGYSVASAVASLTSFVLTFMGFAQNPTLMPIGGLLQRLTITIGWIWLAALALHLSRDRYRRY